MADWLFLLLQGSFLVWEFSCASVREAELYGNDMGGPSQLTRCVAEQDSRNLEARDY